MVRELVALQSCFAALSRPEQESVIRRSVCKGCPETLLPLVTGLSVELIRRIMGRRGVGS
jgi:hypothetical protein